MVGLVSVFYFAVVVLSLNCEFSLPSCFDFYLLCWFMLWSMSDFGFCFLGICLLCRLIGFVNSVCNFMLTAIWDGLRRF